MNGAKIKDGGDDAGNCKPHGISGGRRGKSIRGEMWSSPILDTISPMVNHLLIASQKFHSQCDAVVPSLREDADKAGVEGHIKHVLLVRIVVMVALEYLFGEGKEEKRRG